MYFNKLQSLGNTPSKRQKEKVHRREGFLPCCRKGKRAFFPSTWARETFYLSCW